MSEVSSVGLLVSAATIAIIASWTVWMVARKRSRRGLALLGFAGGVFGTIAALSLGMLWLFVATAVQVVTSIHAPGCNAVVLTPVAAVSDQAFPAQLSYPRTRTSQVEFTPAHCGNGFWALA